jgi:hypothetical protein
MAIEGSSWTKPFLSYNSAFGRIQTPELEP